MRGKKYNDDIQEQALDMLSTNNNTSEIARVLGINESTLRTWRNDKRNDEFAELRQERKKEFVESAWEIIRLSQEFLRCELKQALTEGGADIGKLSTIIGTMYDKQALASNENTVNIGGQTLEELLKRVEGSDY